MIQVPITWDRANRKKDRSVSLGLTTNFEISNEDFAEMDRNVGHSGWFLFKENSSFDPLEVPKEDAPVDGKKPSVRLRSVIYRYWEQQTDHSEEFDTYYSRHMEKLIEQYKEKLV